MAFQNKNFNSQAARRIYNINSLNSNIALEILKNHEFKAFSEPHNNLLNPLNEEKKSVHDDELSFLKVTGKEVLKKQSLLPSTTQKFNPQKSSLEFRKNIKEIKVILEQSPNEIQSIVEKNHRKSKINAHSPSKDLTSYGKFGTSLGSDTYASQKNINPQKFYEEAILSDPVLYHKVVTSYRAMQRSMKRTSVGNSNKVQTFVKRPSLPQQKIQKTEKPKFLPKIQNEQDTKSQQEKKKISVFNLYRQFQLMINLSNSLVIVPEAESSYKAFICKGNNGLLVKSILKTRPWWSIRSQSDVDACNFIWTEWKRPKYIKGLPCALTQEKIDQNALICQGSEFKQFEQQNTKKLLSIMSEGQYLRLKSALSTGKPQELTKFHKRMGDSYIGSILSKAFPEQHQRTTSKMNKILNHVPGCFHLHSKKLLFANMKKHYLKNNLEPFAYLPETYVISKGTVDPEFERFLGSWNNFEQLSKKNPKAEQNIWICKPGENSNRGHGITVVRTLNEIRSFISSYSSGNGTALVQKYMENPFLYNKRKFDIRCFILITAVNGVVKGYWYEDGYLRTTSIEYSLKNVDNRLVHLTNDAIQKKSEGYGKFENCNKISFQEFEKYLSSNYPDRNYDFARTAQKMKSIAADLILSVGSKLNPDRKEFCFELFGLDYMLDEDLEPVIIEANSNPSLEVQGNVLGKIIPTLLENVIRLAIDPIFPPPLSENPKNTKYCPGNCIEQNRFSIIYDSLKDQSKYENPTKEEEEEQRAFNQEVEQEPEDDI